MKYFNLPKRSQVNRVVPKNAFDPYINTKQKKLFTDKIQRITWTHKLSVDTINLSGKDISEIQLFKIELKAQEDIARILEIIDKAIPYPIVFSVQYDEQIYLSTSAKHPHPTKANQAVIDWTFKTDWMGITTLIQYELHLKKSLDAVFKDFCLQLSDIPAEQAASLGDIIQYQQKTKALEKEIKKLKSLIKKSKQFNQKVEWNMKLKKQKKLLEQLQEKGAKGYS